MRLVLRRAERPGADLIQTLAAVALAGVFAVGAIAKLADPRRSRAAIVAFGVPPAAAGTLGWVLIGCEFAVAAALLPIASRVPAGVGGLALLTATTAAVVVNLMHGRRPDCNCFGRLSRGPIGAATVARNALLASLAGFVVAGGRAPLVFGALALIAAAAWLGLGRLGERSRGGWKAPSFSLADTAGATWTLERLLARGRPVLLVFSHPACGACRALHPDLAAWQARLADRLTVALVLHGAPPDHPDAPYPVLVDPDASITEAYRVSATPSAALVGADGRNAGPLARGAGEITALLDARSEDNAPHDAAPRFARRALIARAARGAAALGAFPLVAAACGSSGSSSSKPRTTTTTSSRPKALKIGNTYICEQKYALCTNAPCVPSKHDPNVVVCECVVESGYSVGFTACPKRAPHGTSIHSTFSTALATSSAGAMTCPADAPWANCLDYPCELDPNDPNKAHCQCALVKTGPSFTFGGDCNTRTCKTTIWSGAHTNAGGPSIATAMKRLGQPLAFPKPCPKA